MPRVAAQYRNDHSASKTRLFATRKSRSGRYRPRWQQDLCGHAPHRLPTLQTPPEIQPTIDHLLAQQCVQRDIANAPGTGGENVLQTAPGAARPRCEHISVKASWTSSSWQLLRPRKQPTCPLVQEARGVPQRLEQAVKQCPEVAIDVFLVDKLIMSEHQLKQQIVRSIVTFLAGRLAK